MDHNVPTYEEMVIHSQKRLIDTLKDRIAYLEERLSKLDPEFEPWNY